VVHSFVVLIQMKSFRVVCILSLLLFAGCSFSRRTTPEFSARQNGDVTECKIKLYRGGGTSRKFQRYEETFRSFNVTVTTNTASIANRGDVLVIDAASLKGQRIIQMIQTEKPWLWQGFEGYAFANELFLDGQSGDKSWSYKTVYPDKKLERLIVQLRRELRRK
jgi:hypothetical protein